MTGKSERKTGCPIAFTLDQVGDKWSLLIIRDMLVNDATTYGDFMCGGEGIATNILASRLKVLTEAGIVQKHRDPDNKRSYLYSLTEKGRALAPIVKSLMDWGARFDPQTKATPQIIQSVTRILEQE